MKREYKSLVGSLRRELEDDAAGPPPGTIKTLAD